MLIHITRVEWENRRMALVQSGKLSGADSIKGKVIAFPNRIAEPLNNTVWAL